MSDGEHEGQEFEQDRPADPPESIGGLRRAMEHRVSALQEAEDRIRREQSALQEQAKVVFAEREARLARRERELAKREAALAVSEGIAAGVPAERDKDLEEREQRRRRPRGGAGAAPGRAGQRAPARRAAPPPWPTTSRVAELEQTVNELEERLAAAGPGAGRRRRRARRCRRAPPSWTTASTAPRRSRRCCTQKELHLDGARADILQRESEIAEQEQALNDRAGRAGRARARPRAAIDRAAELESPTSPEGVGAGPGARRPSPPARPSSRRRARPRAARESTLTTRRGRIAEMQATPPTGGSPRPRRSPRRSPERRRSSRRSTPGWPRWRRGERAAERAGRRRWAELEAARVGAAATSASMPPSTPRRPPARAVRSLEAMPRRAGEADGRGAGSASPPWPTRNAQLAEVDAKLAEFDEREAKIEAAEAEVR